MAGYKALALTQEMFCGRLRGCHPGYEINVNPLPKDAKVVSMKVHPDTGELEFMIFSEQYEWTKPGLPLAYAPVPMYVPYTEPK